VREGWGQGGVVTGRETSCCWFGPVGVLTGRTLDYRAQSSCLPGKCKSVEEREGGNVQGEKSLLRVLNFQGGKLQRYAGGFARARDKRRNG